LKGFREPLHAFYAVECLPVIEHALKYDVRKVTSFFDSIRVTEVKEESLQDIPGYRKSFMNINTRSQLDAWLKSQGGS
jgi:molybdopterin-guanine dinucleotide biosynthesis protein A